MLEQSYHRGTASESQSVTLTLCASTFAGLFVDVAPASRPRAGAKPVRVTLKHSLCCFDRTHLSGPAWTSVKIAQQAERYCSCISKGPVEAGAMIRKLKSGKYRLYSRKADAKTGKRRNLGTFDSREAAEKHERAVQYFKHKG